LIDKAFRDLGARRVVASTMTVNAGSRRVMEKCGMSFVRTFFMDWPDKIAGSEQGDVEYAIGREEWARGHAPPEQVG
jgi:RimJ/RimL family protein N-acetyltransferase